MSESPAHRYPSGGRPMAEPSTSQDSGPQPTNRPNGRRLAIVSIVCGALGFATCGVSAILGLILGILALTKSGQGPAAGRARGRNRDRAQLGLPVADPGRYRGIAPAMARPAMA